MNTPPATPPTNMDDTIDSRDVIERIKWLGSYPEAADVEELAILKALAKEGEDSPDWSHGETLIRYSYFEEYAQELAEDCGVMNDNQENWPNNCIDWEQAARELQMDYMSIKFDGVEYWIRAQTQTQAGGPTMLSRKDYEAIAEIVKQQIEDEIGGKAGAILIAYDLTDYFAQNNPRFDRGAFLEMCGL